MAASGILASMIDLIVTRRAIKIGATGLFRALKRSLQDRRGNITVLVALALPPLFGFSSLAVDLSRGLNQRVKNQMVADAAALSATVAYSASGQNAAAIDATVQAVAVANGLAATAAVGTTVNNYPTSGNTAVKVTVTTAVPIYLAGAMGFKGTFNVTTTSYASMVSDTGFNPCFLALSNSSSALQTQGGGSINASNCDVAAVGTISNLGSSITASKIVSSGGGVTNDYGSLTTSLIQYATSFTNPSWNTNVPASSKIVKSSKTTLVDYWASNSDLSSLRSQIGSWSSPSSLSSPSTQGGQDWNLNFSPNGTVAAYQTSPNSGNYVIPKGTYKIGSLNIAGGAKVTFASGSTITVKDGVVIGGGCTVNFGASNLYVNNGFNGGSGFTMGDGILQIGGNTATFSGTTTIGNGAVTLNVDTTVNGGATLTMGTGTHSFQSLTVNGKMLLGNGNLDIIKGLSIAGGSTLVAGDGNYRIGAGSSNAAITIGGSGVLITGNGGFSVGGNITTAGGSRLVIGDTTAHYIKGNLSIAGSALFGSGAYLINGDFTNGTGGTVWPYNDTVSNKTYGNSLQGVSTSGYDMAGVYVTFALTGTLNLGGGAKTLLIAPNSTTSGGAIRDLLVDSQTSAATTWSQGSANTFAGSVHLPNSALTISGGSSTLSNGQCFMLTAKTITVSGGGVTGSNCTSVNQSTSSSSSSSSATSAQLVG